MVKWSQQVVKTLGFDRSCVALAFSLLDRYLSATRNSVLVDQGDYQLYSITLLYTSIKLIDSEKKLGVNDMIRICGGVHNKKDIEAAELHVLKTLKWQVSPPLAVTFAEYLMELVPVSQKERIRQKCLDVIDVAVADSHLGAKKASTIAVAAIVVAMMDVDGFTGVPQSAVLERFLDDVDSMTRIPAKGEESFEIISRLETMYFSSDAVVSC